MASDENKRYPDMSVGQWWALRKKFRNSIPKEVTKNYIASVLGMQEDSARANIIPTLYITGIIDKDGKPTDRARQWRDDSQYKQVCDSIRTEVYPQELLDIAHDTSADETMVKNWFANRTGHGNAATRKHAAFYMLLLEGDPSKESEPKIASVKPSQKNSATKTQPKPKTASQPSGGEARVISELSQEPMMAEQAKHTVRSQPAVHIDIQIHITPDFTADQIDQVFASMAKHLKDFI
jgi:hypothetical protein